MENESRFRPQWSARSTQTIDMSPDGSFRDPAPLAGRIFRFAVIAAVIATAAAVAALALWFALVLIPIAVAAGLIAYLALRWRLWRAGYAAPRRGVFRP